MTRTDAEKAEDAELFNAEIAGIAEGIRVGPRFARSGIASVSSASTGYDLKVLASLALANYEPGRRPGPRE